MQDDMNYAYGNGDHVKDDSKVEENTISTISRKGGDDNKKAEANESNKTTIKPNTTGVSPKVSPRA